MNEKSKIQPGGTNRQIKKWFPYCCIIWAKYRGYWECQQGRVWKPGGFGEGFATAILDLGLEGWASPHQVERKKKVIRGERMLGTKAQRPKRDHMLRQGQGKLMRSIFHHKIWYLLSVLYIFYHFPKILLMNSYGVLLNTFFASNIYSMDFINVNYINKFCDGKPSLH